MAETPYPMPPRPRPLTETELSHLSHRWAPNKDDDRYSVFTACGDTKCYACEVGGDMSRGRYEKAATEDGVPTWLLPDSHRNEEEAAEDWTFFLEGRTDHIDPKAVWKK